MRDNVARLRALLSEAKRPADAPCEVAEREARASFAVYEFNTSAPVTLDQSPRARTEREIMRIASWYNWPLEVARALDAEGANTLGDLSDDGTATLLERLQRLETCMQEGLDPPDSAPAR